MVPSHMTIVNESERKFIYDIDSGTTKCRLILTTVQSITAKMFTLFVPGCHSFIQIYST